jgi:hypothetical protein
VKADRVSAWEFDTVRGLLSSEAPRFVVSELDSAEDEYEYESACSNMIN